MLTTYNSNKEKNYKSIFFKIENIKIENTKIVDLLELKRDLEFLKGTSLLFLDEVKVINVITKYEFIENMRLRKSYPNTVEIIIFEKKPIAVQILGNIKFYISEKGEKLNFFKNEFYEDLPIIFGNQKNFSSFFSEIKQSDLPSNQIKAFYYFDIGRWDIVLKNKKIIKELINSDIGVLITDHNVRETLKVCDEAYIISDGKVIAHGKPSKIVKDKIVQNVYLGDNFKL